MNLNPYFLIPEATLKEAFNTIENTYGHLAIILDKNNKLIGLVTDGDIRRLILKVQKPIAALFVDDVKVYCTKIYASITPDTSLKSAILLMEELNIWDLPVVDNANNLKGLLLLVRLNKFDYISFELTLHHNFS